MIITHRDLVALAPQPLYLARGLAAKGLRVALVSTSPPDVCRALTREKFTLISPGRWRMKGRTGLFALYAAALPPLLRCRVAINFDIGNLWPVAFAARIKKFASVLYWLEPFYGDYGLDNPSRSSRLGHTALRRLIPPDVVVDVNEERLDISRGLCGQPNNAFVVRNVPPMGSGWNIGSPAPRSGYPRLVYAGSVSGLAYEGVELLIRGFAESKTNCTLAIYPAEGCSAAAPVAELIAAYGLGDRVELFERVEREELPATLAKYDVGVVFYPARAGQNINASLAAPNKLFEYMASGLAVLASNNATLQFVSRQGLGWNVAGAAVSEIAELLKRVECRSAVELCRRNAYEAFRQMYHYEVEAAPLIEWVWQAVLSARGR